MILFDAHVWDCFLVRSAPRSDTESPNIQPSRHISFIDGLAHQGDKESPNIQPSTLSIWKLEAFSVSHGQRATGGG